MRERMRATLEDAAKRDLRRVHQDGPGAAHWPAHPSSLAALVRRDYLDHKRLTSKNGRPVDVWTITELGREVLKGLTAWIPDDKPEFMAPGGGRTKDHSRSVDRDPQMGAMPILDADSLKTKWRRQSEKARLASLERKFRARQAAEKARYAA
jgi:DNA-binding PadR family transcriptional regulator